MKPLCPCWELGIDGVHYGECSAKPIKMSFETVVTPIYPEQVVSTFDICVCMKCKEKGHFLKDQCEDIGRSGDYCSCCGRTEERRCSRDVFIHDEGYP